MDSITEAAKEYVLSIAKDDVMAGAINSRVPNNATYQEVESAFITGAKWVCNMIGGIHYLQEDLYENQEGNKVDDMTSISMSRGYTLVLRSGDKVQARRIWERNDPVWR